jgi:tetratricopeptide (TPR) repeat protein
LGHAADLEAEYAKSPSADPGALERAAGLYLNAGEPQKALPLAQQAVASHPSPQSEDLLGRALLAAGQAAEGSRHLKKAWTAAQNDPQISFDYAQALLTTQDFTQAGNVLEGALTGNPNSIQLRLALGVARYGQRRVPEAIAAFLKTISLDPHIAQPYVFLGRMLDQAGTDLPAIVADYRRWLQLEPKQGDPPLLLAKALIASNQNGDEAESLLRRSIHLNATSWEAHYQLGLLLSTKHEYKKAADELERSIRLSPNEPMPHYHLARVYDRLGSPDRAAAEREIHKRLTAGPTHQ